MSRNPIMRAVCVLALALGVFAFAVAASAAPQNPVVSGTVFGSDGAAIPGATVAVFELNKGVFRPVTSMAANAAGAWTYSAKPATYRFDISAPSTDPTSVTLATAKAGVYSATVTLPAYGAIGGTITSSADGAALSGATVEFFRRAADGSWPAVANASAVTAADGTYASGPLPAGAWAVKATLPGFVSAFLGGAEVGSATVLDVGRAVTRTASFALEPVPAPPSGATISGVVVRGATRTPMPDVFVYLYRQNDDGTWPATSPGWGSPTKTVYSAANGSWSSGLVALGNYRVRFFDIHTGSQWWQYVATVDLATPVVLSSDGQVVTGIDGWYAKP